MKRTLSLLAVLASVMVTALPLMAQQNRPAPTKPSGWCTVTG